MKATLKEYFRMLEEAQNSANLQSKELSDLKQDFETEQNTKKLQFAESIKPKEDALESQNTKIKDMAYIIDSLLNINLGDLVTELSKLSKIDEDKISVEVFSPTYSGKKSKKKLLSQINKELFPKMNVNIVGKSNVFEEGTPFCFVFRVPMYKETKLSNGKYLIDELVPVVGYNKNKSTYSYLKLPDYKNYIVKIKSEKLENSQYSFYPVDMMKKAIINVIDSTPTM